jgi:general secretion pathway protein G
VKKAFTMIELVFVIVVLGILAAIAIPKLAPIMEDATTARGKSDVASIRIAIVNERQGRLLQGQTAYITKLDHAANNNAGVTVFDDNDDNETNGKLLSQGIVTGSGDGKWMKTGEHTYTYQSGDATTTFTYTQSNGKFDCDETAGDAADKALCAYIRK